MENLWRDLTFARRTLLRNPGFTIVAVLSLAIGIGANSAIFSVINGLLLRPLPFKDAERLVILWSRSPGLNVPQDWFSPGQYLDVKADNQVFEETAITIGGSFNLTGQGAPEHIDGARVSSSLFSLLGASPMLGRAFSSEDDQPGKQASVILCYGFWKRAFGGDPNVTGKTLTMNGNSFTIAGVMPASFVLNKEIMPAVNGIQNAELLVPLPLAESARANRGNEDFNIFAKLKPGVTVARAQSDMDVIAGRMKEQYPANYPPTGGLTISVVPLLGQVVGDIHLALFILFGAVGFVLLIACANVANLLLARAGVRQKEIAVRAAVGASRARLMRQLITESVLLAVAGGAVGLAIAVWAVDALSVAGSENIPRLGEAGIDIRVLVFTAGVALLTGIVFGLVPAMRASRVDLNEALKDGGRASGGVSSRGQHRMRGLLVVAEIALSLVLLVGAGLLIRSYARVTSAYPGFDPHNVLSLRLALPNVKYKSQDEIAAFFKRASEHLKTLPEISAVGTSYSLPMSTVALAWEPIKVEGYAPKTAQERIISNTRIVNPEYFRAMGIRIVQGRLFDEHDTKGQPQAVIVNEAFAERFWPNQDPIGKRLQQADADGWRTVVGIIGDAREYSAEKEPPIAVYYPFEQYVARNMFLLVRTTSDPSAMAASITREIQSLDPDLPVFDVASMEQRLHDSLARRRFAMLLLTVFAALALILGAIGIYGVMACSVNQRTHEIGIRMALGAEPRNILKIVIRQAATLTLTGIAFGLGSAFALTRLLSSLLYGVGATDWVTFFLTPFLLGAVALFAAYVPARRAAKVDPMVALRNE